MGGTIVTGDLALIDATVVRFLHGLKVQRGSVWASPTAALFSPAVSLSDLRYALRQLACVEGVSSSLEGLPPDLPVTNFPAELTAQPLAIIRTPINDDDETPPTCTIEELLRERPKPLIMLSGCFDLIHAGHIRLIELAASYGAPPVVAMLTTRAIRRQPKNVNRQRPLWTMADRVALLEELRTKPRPLLFDGPDCLDLIRRLRPDIWVKERKERGRAIVEAEARLVEQLGGRVVWVNGAGYGCSSTAIEEALLSRTVSPE